MNTMTTNSLQADLRTAQNRMLPFVESAINDMEQDGKVDMLFENPEKVTSLFLEVRSQLLSLLNIEQERQQQWHIGVADSGKRTIEILVNYLCQDHEDENAVVNTENYVAFNKFSAANALSTQKKVSFLKPFNLDMGQSLTIGSEQELAEAQKLIEKESISTLWLAWNSTSTGIRENVDQLVAFRNSCKSDTLIISDAASLPLFSANWQNIQTENLPDVFFFSLRKQGLPYDGPQDEANQAKNSGALFLFNDRALQRAQNVQGKNLYDSPELAECAAGAITLGDQRRNHIKHLLKLNAALEIFLAENGKKLTEHDQTREQIQQALCKAFSQQGQLGQCGYTLLASPEAQSLSSYIVKVPESSKPSETVAELKSRGIQVSVSMHPQVSNQEYLRFACYPGNTMEEMEILIQGFRECLNGRS